jgi:hypothetical protein
VSAEEPFERDEHVDKPGIIGARWWQEGLAQVDPVARRSALKGILIGAGALVGVGTVIALASSSSSAAAQKTEGADEDFKTDQKLALDMQREYGWNFGATSDRLVFDGTSTAPFDKSRLSSLALDLVPTNASYAPFFVRSLLDAPTALRKTTPAGDPDTFTPLKDVLVPIFTAAMDAAYRRGKALANLFDAAHHDGTKSIAVIVDLPGPEAVAFAAGASSALDPVFLFDNWPHPKGVVASHLTLAACAYYQPLFAAKNTPPIAPPLFVLDRNRLSAYSDDAKQFDNRYIARVPSTPVLAKLGISRVLYITPSDVDRELDDLNDDFVYTVKQGAQLKLLGASALASGLAPTPPPGTTTTDAGVVDTGPQYFYGGDPTTHEWFWIDYPWSAPYTPKGGKPPVEPTFSRTGPSYVPVARPSPFSTGALAGSLTPPRPIAFGTVPVVIAATTGVILGAKMSRSGSWTRSSSWGYG